MTSAEDRYVFHVEWHDAQADLLRRYMVTYFLRDNTIGMYDLKSRRDFLKRSEVAGVKLSDLYIGSIITILARQLKVIEYADDYTRNALETTRDRTLALVKPDAYSQVGHILSAIHGAGFVVASLKMVRMGAKEAQEFADLSGRGEVDPRNLSADVVVAIELVGDDAVRKWLAMIGPASPDQARREAPRSIRAAYGADESRNAVYGSADARSAAAEIDFFFGRPWPATALFNNCTLCVVRPHAFASAGDIVTRILQEGFEISAMRVWHLDKATAEEFSEVYRGVSPEYHDMVGQLCAGPSLVMEIRQEDAVPSFRQLVGPMDPEVAKHLRPNTLRAKFGVDRVKNAVHCTDLPEDGLIEVEYFFNIMYKKG